MEQGNRKSERIMKKRGETTNPPPIIAGTSAEPVRIHENISIHSNAKSVRSVSSQKRIAEARAARMLAELEEQRVAVAARQAVIRAQLEEEKAIIESSSANSASSQHTRSVQRWVEECDPGHGDGDARQLNEGTHIPPSPSQKETGEIALLARAITDAIKTNADTGKNAATDKFLGRMATKELPIFDGDPMEWLRFKRAYDTTTSVGSYSDVENVARLQRCLRGAAWEAVAARLVTDDTSATDIMRTLEMRFGRPELVLHLLLCQMRKVPKLSGVRSELITLATKVANCTAAIKATGCIEYMYNPDLVNEIVNKLTETLLYRWLDYWSYLKAHQPRLSALSDFLMQEAERLCRAGVVELPPQRSTRITSTKPVFMIDGDDGAIQSTSVNVVNNNSLPKSNKENVDNCIYCDSSSHGIFNCSLFTALDLNSRWKWICEKKLCFKCFSSKHRRERCKSRQLCKTCGRGHHSSLHREDWSDWKVADTSKQSSTTPTHVAAIDDMYPVQAAPITGADSSETTANVWANGSKSSRVYLKILPVTLEGPLGSVKVLALLDEGSTVCLVDSSIADKIGADGPSVDLSLQGAIGSQSQVASKLVSLTLRTPYGTHILQKVRTVERLTLPAQSISFDSLSRHDYLQDIPIELYEGKPMLLIGQDYWPLIISREVRQGRMNDPVASRTELGWVVHGFVSSISKITSHEFSYHVHEQDVELHELVKDYFRVDSLGIRNETQQKLSRDDQRALHILDTKSRKVNGKWETGLLWRSDNVRFPDNKNSALKRLAVIEKMMCADPSYATDYTKQVQNMLDSDYAEEVSGPVRSERIWYLPHFGVRNPNKPGKLRLVHDAKAETKGISLNTELLTGPDLLNSLIGVLIRFRERKVAVTGDIKEMFMRVKIREEDQSAQLFLWRPDKQRGIKTFKMTSMIFGAKSSPCTATYILRRNADSFEQSHPRAVMAIKRRHYVDDYVDSVDTEEEMRQLVSDVVMIHASGGFELRGFVSNVPSCLAESSQSPSVNLLDSDKVQRTLGMTWKPLADMLGFDVSLKKVDSCVANGERSPTKREVLSVVMSVFDPLGFLSPLQIRAKLLLQDVWRSGLQWDESIGDKFTKVWFQWLQDLKKCQSFSVPRCYGFEKLDQFELHTFVDASEQAYAAVSYLRHEGGQVAFVAGKTRVAPLKMCTVPRLELQAALMGARLASMITKEQDLNIIRRIFWTDSQVVWYWIQNSSQSKKSFVFNRLNEILSLTKSSEWRWLPGDLNVADEATRAKVSVGVSCWISGPSFLRLPEVSWPAMIPQFAADQAIEVTLAIDDIHIDFSLPDVVRFSKWLRLLRTTAYILLFVECLRNRSRVSLETRHLDKAEDLWIMSSQQQSFKEEIAQLKAGRCFGKSSCLKNLHAFLDGKGILRLKGRANAVQDIERDMLEPVILDGRHPYTRLLTKHYHEKAFHGSTETVVNQLRGKYWILNLRPTVRRIVFACQFCRIRRARPAQPITGDLPLGRLAHRHRPFTHCGVDYFGPMQVAIGRRREKRYGALFTCLTTRAIHIELAGSLSTDSVIMAMRRMMSRRGCPAIMYSDNGTNFHGACRELRAVLQEINQDAVSNFLTNKRIDWRFNPPVAPHTGGVWERLVRSVKRCLGVVLKEQAPKEELLLTLLAEVENILNSRPLTHVTVEPSSPEALTPNHFLLGGPSDMPWLGDCESLSTKCWRNAQRLADQFWRRWVREFLPTVLPRASRADPTNVGEGTLVIIVDPALPRNVWPRGTITRLYPGPDGVSRVADIRTAGGLIRRHLNKLIVI